MTFEELGVRTRTCQSLLRSGIVDPNPVQQGTVPVLLAGRDAVIEAPTGSGKTYAFLIPLVEKLTGHRPDGVRALIVGPTRELATQIATVLNELDPSLRVALLFGGVPYGKQLASLRNAPDVVIGCPGRILDLAGQGHALFQRVEYLVLDEADEMFDQGFARDVERLIALTPTAGRQTVLASATMPDWVRTMIRKHLHDSERIVVRRDVEPSLEHGLLAVPRGAKIDTLHALLRREPGQTIVFHRTKHGAKKLARDLDKRGHFAGELQGNLSQNARDRVISSFRKRETWVLVATNVAARGLDIDGVGLVVNYELPDTPQWLTHRVGRTARNGETGRALTFITEDDHPQWRKLRRLGAPDLPHLDRTTLLEQGEWCYEASQTPPPAPRAEIMGRNPTRQRGGPRRRGRYDRGAGRG